MNIVTRAETQAVYPRMVKNSKRYYCSKRLAGIMPGGRGKGGKSDLLSQCRLDSQVASYTLKLLSRTFIRSVDISHLWR